MRRAPQRNWASGSQERDWEGWCLTTSVLGSETTVLDRENHPNVREVTVGRGRLTVDEMCVLKDTLELAKGKEGMFANWGMHPALSRLLPAWGP